MSGRYLGLGLGGGKKNRISAVSLSLDSQAESLAVTGVYLGSDTSKSGAQLSAETQFLNWYSYETSKMAFESVGISAPLTVPKCFECPLKCPGEEVCTEEEIVWMRAWQKKRKKVQKRVQLAPYVERCFELFALSELDPPFHFGHAFGPNRSTLAARARFLIKRISSPCLEVLPSLSLWRVARDLGVPKKVVSSVYHSLEGEKARLRVLERFRESELLEISEAESRIFSSKIELFEGLIMALTCFLHSRGLCEERPEGFPAREGWVAFPIENAFIAKP